jgi:RNA 3'-terminal phosphate cyclase (ATP)
LKAEIETPSAPSPGPGTMLFLVAEYEHATAGFTGYGRLRYPAENVADDAYEAFEAHLKAGGALDPHAADQVLLPLALAPGASTYTTSEVTRHLLTNAWVIRQFVQREITIEGEEGEPGKVQLH